MADAARDLHSSATKAAAATASLAPLPELAVALTTKDSSRTIAATVASIRGLAGRIVVIDSGSTDGTIEQCRAVGAVVEHRAWPGHVAQKQYAIDRCAEATWVLLLDSDESVSPELSRAIRAALTSATAAGGAGPDGFEVNRRLVLHGSALGHAYQPEWRLRLFRRGAGRVAGVDPHDRIEVTGRVGRLEGDLLHDSFANVGDMLARQLRYAVIAADEAMRNGDRSGGRILDIAFRPAAAFLKQFLLKRAFLDGWRGLAVAGGAAAAALMKHLVLAERRGLALASEQGSEPPHTESRS